MLLRSASYWFAFVSFVLGPCSAIGTANTLFTGTFTADDQMEIFSFVAGPGTATLQTLGYAGNGGSVSAGGFDPILSLFGPGVTLQATTALLTSVNDGSPNLDPVNSDGLDSFIDTTAQLISLTNGATYYLVLTVSGNSPNGPTNTYGDGFSQQGTGNFTDGLYGCGGGPFCSIDTDIRTGSWAVDFGGVTNVIDLSAGVPEPATWWMMMAACVAGLGLRLRMRMSRVRR